MVTLTCVILFGIWIEPHRHMTCANKRSTMPFLKAYMTVEGDRSTSFRLSRERWGRRGGGDWMRLESSLQQGLPSQEWAGTADRRGGKNQLVHPLQRAHRGSSG